MNPLFKCAYDREKLNQNAISLAKFKTTSDSDT